MSVEKKFKDIESQVVPVDSYSSTSDESLKDGSPESKSKNWFSFLSFLGEVETRGIERVPEDERTDTSWLSPFMIFFSPNISIGSISTGALGTAAFGLDFWTCTILIVVFAFIGALPVGLYAVYGMKFGLRQQILSRFLVGNTAARFFALLNVISCIGWNAMNTIAAVELLKAVGPIPPPVGCVIIVGSTMFLALFGYKVIHLYEKWSSIPNVIICFIIIARLKIEGDFVPGDMSADRNKIGNILTFISLIFGFCAGWVPSAADYTVYVPSNTSPERVFWPMVWGLTLPSIFTLILGAAMGACTFNNARLSDAYSESSIGGLTYGILVTDSLGTFGKICCVVFALSTIANNLPGSYSLSLSIQAVWSKLAKIPRIIWCIIGNAISLGISIPAYYSFSSALENFLSIIGYNTSIYLGICLSEHIFARKNSFKNYDLTFDESKNNFREVRVGYAGLITMLIGWFFAFVGMDQTWFVGLASRHIPPSGGDIGWEVCITSTFIIHSILRPLELKYIEKR
ncbi:hypothetical protein DASC09_018280 [Saccharomycopsis crataegensis]|uniref:Purine-cytosine permease n=1 Tax=Saccharomycopsis crataegensis TaxID=43959 RepID=A0AAV5QI35_9ASCO|nr:hypothetical protein DASC09_018280 [Saccharomycopsis crataegensis]